MLATSPVIVNPAANLRLMVLKFDGARTPPLAFFAAKAVSYAAGFGLPARRADVINASWHVLDDQGLLRQALLFAQNRVVLVVCAAGNNGGDNTRIPTIPASYAFDNMIAVAASDRHDGKAGFSNYGATVDIAAPGTDVLSTAIYFARPAPLLQRLSRIRRHIGRGRAGYGGGDAVDNRRLDARGNS